MLSATDIHLAFGPQVVLDGVSLTLDGQTRAGLVGANGSGKSSLLRILAGIDSADQGAITLAKEATLAYLPQRLDVPPDTTVWDLADLGFDNEHRLQDERQVLAHRLSGDPHNNALLRRVAEIDDVLEHQEYYQRSARIGPVLDGLGFAPTDLNRPLEEFSGGWQMRAALARTLLTRADFVLLDEPTNYLDSEARLWLASFIRTYRGGVVLVSHDRAFLDEAINVVLELFQGSVRRYRGSFSDYETQRREELEQLARKWAQQQRELQRQEDFIQRFRAKASKARQVQSRVKALEKTDRIEIPQHLRPISISLPPAPHSGEIVISAEAVSKQYGGPPVLDRLDLTVRRQQKLAVVGLNGAGKSTLLRILAGVDSASGGTITLGTDVRLAYFAQDSADQLPENVSVYEYLAATATDDARSRLQSVLGAFLFDEDAIQKPLSVLSGGERSRLVMASLLLKPVNLLVLDEPTNHLDMTSQRVLSQALQAYQGTVVLVSHDRQFLRDVATDVLALWPNETPNDARPPRAWRFYPGNYREFETSHLGQVFFSDAAARRPSSDPSSSPGSEADYAVQKAMRGELRRLERREHELLETIAGLEQQHQTLQAAMAEEANYIDADVMRDLQAQLANNEDQQAQKAQDWETITLRLEELRNT